MNIKNVFVDLLQSPEAHEKILGWKYYKLNAYLKINKGEEFIELVLFDENNYIKNYVKKVRWENIFFTLNQKDIHKSIAKEAYLILKEVKEEVEKRELDLKTAHNKLDEVINEYETPTFNVYRQGGFDVYAIKSTPQTTYTMNKLNITDDEGNVVAVIDKDGYRPIKKDDGE